MGTSNQYGGPGSGTPLVPAWLEPSVEQLPGAGSQPAPGAEDLPAAPTPRVAPVPPTVADRFATARNNFSRFAGSGGDGRRNLGRAVSHYVSTSSGGSRNAVQRLGSSRVAASRLVGFLADVRENGARAALRTLNLEALAGQSVQNIFIGIADYVCPPGGSIDEGIARDAFVETIVELTQLGVTDLDSLTAEQLQSVFERFATHVIEARICNDIGANMLVMPSDLREAEAIQAQLHDFIGRSVSDALTSAQTAVEALTQARVNGFVDQVYESAFSILQALGDEAGDPE
jgi:hypothetical protein